MAADFCIISLFYVPGMFSFVGTHETPECECEDCEAPNYAEQCDGCLQLLAPAQDSGEHQATQLFLF